MRNRRSVISAGRREELHQKNAVYLITCGKPYCPYKECKDSCEVGFFSLFIHAVYGIDFARRHHLPYYIDYANTRYCYTDHSGDNLWDYYFIQPLNKPQNGILNKFYEVYPLRVWNRQYIRELHDNVVSSLIFQPEIMKKFSSQTREFKSNKVLGVQVRGTDHAIEATPLSRKKYFQTIDRKIREYDYLFIATDEQRHYDTFYKRYGNKLLSHSVVRSANKEAVHLNPSNRNRRLLGEEVLLDCYSLSQCAHAILMHSNVSYGAVLFNPDLSYQLIENWESRYKRLKTLMVYLLNKWGIRKW